jgi:hypothetical protein
MFFTCSYSLAENLAVSWLSTSATNKLPYYLRSRPEVNNLPYPNKMTALRFYFVLKEVKIS